MKFKTVELLTKDGYDFDYDFLFQDIKQELDCIMEEKGISYKEVEDVKIYGDISYSQGRGIGLDGFSLDMKSIEKLLDIKFNTKTVMDVSCNTKFYGSRWTKEVNIDVEYEDGFEYGCDVFENSDGYCDEEELEKIFQDKIKEIEESLLKFGEDMREERQEEDLCFQALNRFFEENKIEGTYMLWDFNYTTKKEDVKEGMIHIATEGDTNIDGLRVELGKIEKHTREIEIKEDGKIVKSKEEVFYIIK